MGAMLKKIIGALLFGAALLAIPIQSTAGILVSINLAPPALPVYVQPICPAPGYIWTPGYWSYDDVNGWFWVPGTWVLAPEPGLLWTPGYWGWGGGVFAWHGGYWGPHVGFYGGVNYGFGYTGAGFFGGRWNGGVFEYNRAVSHIGGAGFHNVYNQRVVNNITVNHVSYNGGAGGLRAQPTAEQRAYDGERHVEPTAEQRQHVEQASGNRALFASVNHGKPAIAATQRPGAFSGHGVVAARSGARLTASQAHAPAARGQTPNVRAEHTPAARAPTTHGSAAHAPAAHRPQARTAPHAQVQQHAPAVRHQAPRAPAPQHAAAAPRPQRAAPQVHQSAPRPQAQHSAPRPAPAPRPQAQHAAPRPAPHPQAAPRPAPHQAEKPRR
jgi:hypothetical protein